MPDTRPIILWNLTNECNLHCNYCFQNAGEHRKNEYELPLERKLFVAKEFIDIGGWAISFTGGEALLRKDHLCKIAKYASERNAYISVMTNGTLLNSETVKELKRNGVERLSVNLDSVNPKIHDSYRGGTGYFEKTLDGILNSIEEGLEVEITATLTQRNFHEIEEYMQFAKLIGAGEVEFSTLLPVGRGKNVINESLTDEQRKIFFKTISKYYTEGQRMMLSNCPYFIPYLIEEKLSGVNDDFGCAAGIAWCAIQPGGLVTPCVLTPDLVVGDLKKESFSEIWQNSEILKKLRDRNNLKGKCADCNHRDSCGGCRALAYALTGDIFEEDTSCILRKNGTK